MKRQSSYRIAVTVVAAIVLISVGFFAWRQTAARRDGGEPPKELVEQVDRGMSAEGRALFEEKVRTLENELSEKQAKGERDVNLLLRLGNAYYTVGALKRAAEPYRDILSTNPNDAPALENLGQTQVEMQDYEGAYESWRRAVNIEPYETTYMRLIDLIDEYLPEYRPQIKEISEAAIANIGQTYGMMIRFGDWYASEEQYDRAVSHYEVALQLNENAEARKQLEEYRTKWREQQTKASAQ